MKKGLLALVCTIVMIILFAPVKAFAGHDIGVLSKSNPYLEVEISMTKDDEHVCFFQIDGEVEKVGLYVKNLSGGGSTIEYDLLDNDWNVIEDYKFDADTIAVEGDIFIPASEYYYIDFKNPSFTGMNEMKLGICVYCPAFGGKASDYSRYNDLNQEWSKKTETVTADKAPLTLSETEVTLKKGKSVTLKATLSKKYKKKGVTWKSSDTKVAKVSKKGKVTAKGYGTAVITCTSKKSKKVKATCTVTVVKKTSSGSGNTETNPPVTSGELSGVSIKVGHGSDNKSVVFRYMAGTMVGADGYYTLKTNDYSGNLTLDFKTSDGNDSHKINVEKNATYYITYSYIINQIQDTVIYNPPQQIFSGTDPITGLPRYITIPGSETRIPAVQSPVSIDVSVQGGPTATNSITLAGTVKKGSFAIEKQ
jgi:hypothetical protein